MKTTSKRASVRSAPTLSMATACGSPWPSRSKAPKMRARRRAPTSALTRERGPRSASAAAFPPGAAHRSSTSSPVRSPARAAAREACSPCTVTRPSRNAALRSTVPAQSAGATRMSAAPPSRAATSRPSSSSRTASREEAARTRRDSGASSRASRASAFAPSAPYRFVQRLCSAEGIDRASSAQRWGCWEGSRKTGPSKCRSRPTRSQAGSPERPSRSARWTLRSVPLTTFPLERPRKSAVARTVSDTAACGGTRSM